MLLIPSAENRAHPTLKSDALQGMRNRLPKLEPGWTLRRAVGMLLTAWLLALPTVSTAHDIPADIVVRAFVKPDGRHLRVLLRVPLGAIVDVDFPQRGP